MLRCRRGRIELTLKDRDPVAGSRALIPAAVGAVGAISNVFVR